MRGKSVVWEHFRFTGENGGKARPASYCSYCNLKYTAPNATKMMRHLLVKCAHCPERVKRELGQSGFGRPRSDTHNLEYVKHSLVRPLVASSQFFQKSDSPTPANSAPSPRSEDAASAAATCSFLTKGLVLPSDMSSTSDSNCRETNNEFSSVDRELAMAIFKTDVPLDITENAHWQEFFRRMNPSYPIPSTAAIVGPLLEAEYVATVNSVSTEIGRTTSAVLLAHGTLSSNDGRANVVLTTPKSIFMDNMSIRQLQSVDEVADFLTAIMKRLEPIRVLLVITDLKQSVRDSWATITKRFPHTDCAGCPIQGLLRIWKAIFELDSIANVVKQAERIGELTNSPWEFPSEDGRDDTSAMLALEKLLGHKDKIHEEVNSRHSSVDPETVSVVKRESFWSTLSLTVIIWRDIQQAVSNLSREETRLSDVVMEMVSIERNLVSKLTPPLHSSREIEVVNAVLNDVSSSCLHAIHYAASLVDPRCMGSCLSEHAINDGMQYIVDMAKLRELDVGRVLANLAECRAKDGRLWSKEYVWEAASHVAPGTWWRGICDKEPLSPIAAALLDLVVSSDMSRLQPYDRGKYLDVDQAHKVLFVRANSELADSASTGHCDNN